MTTATWSDALVTGIADIDRYHQHLFAVVEELRFASQGGTQRALTGDLLERLLAGTMEHFAEEEAEMATAGYPDLEIHHAAHEAFSDEVARLFQAAVNGELVATPTVLAMAKRLVDHVLTHDRLLAAYLRPRQAATA